MVTIPSSSMCSIETYAELVQNIIDASYIDGEEWLYFRACKAAADLTGAKHSIFVLPSSHDKLKVVGCWGVPTSLLEEFSKDRGVIGEAFKSGKPILIDDIEEYKREHSYHVYDELVNSELAIPVIDHANNKVIALFNLEATAKKQFTTHHVNTIYRLSVLTLKHRSLLENLQNTEDYNKFLLQILDNTPDELMVIDNNYIPLFANKVKREKLPSLGQYLAKQEIQGRNVLWQFLFSDSYTRDTQTKPCYDVIEKKQVLCEHCVCKEALLSQRNVHGVLYMPSNIKDILELSAGLLNNDEGPIACIETVRYVTQREKIVETNIIEKLLQARSVKQFFQEVTNLLCHELGYKRARLYLLDKTSGNLTGLTYAGEHKISKKDFDGFTVKTPLALADLKIFLNKIRKAGLLKIGSNAAAKEMVGYWSVGLSRDQSDFIDPQGLLELEDITDLIVIPISMHEKTWLIFIDMKGEVEPRPITNDDLQALTAFSAICSAMLGMVYKNELVFRLAAVGDTAACLSHLHTYRMKPEYFKSIILERFENIVKLGIRYLNSDPSEMVNHCLAEIIGDIITMFDNKSHILSRGAVYREAEHILKDIQNVCVFGNKDDLVYDLVRTSLPSEKIADWLFKLQKYSKDEIVYDLVSEIVSFVFILKEQLHISEDVRILSEAFMEIARKHPDGDINEAAVIDIKLPLQLALDALEKLPKTKGLSVDKRYLNNNKTYHVKIRACEMFLSFQVLLDNAIYAAKKEKHGGGKVSVDIKEDVNTVAVSITNNGEIILPEDRDKVFKEEFSRKPPGKGTGLGLMFAHRFVEDNEGEIKFEIDDAIAETTFTIRLPMVLAETNPM